MKICDIINSIEFVKDESISREGAPLFTVKVNDEVIAECVELDGLTSFLQEIIRHPLEYIDLTEEGYEDEYDAIYGGEEEDGDEYEE
ncbi:MAG: hypothetical protein ACI4RT_03740 [Candidatus Spyradenecus sp.]